MSSSTSRFAPVASSPDDEITRMVRATEAMMSAGLTLQLQGVEDLRLKAILHTLPDFLYVKDRQSRFVFANEVTAACHGVADPNAMDGLTDFDLFDQDTALRYFSIEQEIMETGRARHNMEESFPQADGRVMHRLTSKMALRNEQGAVVGLLGVSRDVTGYKRRDALYRGQARIFEMIARGQPLPEVLDALVRLVEGEIEAVQASILLLDAAGQRLVHGAAPSLPASYTRLINGVMIGPNVGSCGTAAWRAQPVIVKDVLVDPLWSEFKALIEPYGLRSCWSMPIMTAQNNVLGTMAFYSRQVRRPTEAEEELIAIATSIAGIAIERKRLDEQIHFMAHHDDLTGLPNRAFLKARMASILFQAGRNKRKVTVAYMDLDNFKAINDSYGHAAGDEVLKEFAQRMANCLRPSDLIVRLGGDEFLAVLVHQSAHDNTVPRRLKEMLKVAARPMQLGKGEVAPGCSIGVAAFPADGISPEGLIANADAALYRAKALGRSRLHYHDGRNDPAVEMPLSAHEALRKAILSEELFLEYQPQIDVASGRLTALEALVRWRHPERGRVPPGDFIPLAEQSDLIVQLGLWVMNEACRQARSWRDLGLPPVTIAVNVSARQFADPGFVQLVAEAIERHGIEPASLELELTETALMQDSARALSMMEALRALGVGLAIDDFGTGYSSLASLRAFPFNRLKMDRSLIEALPGDETAVAIAQAVMALARTLKLKVVAEGVETDAQLEFLRFARCEEAQGFRFSRPLDAEAVTAMLARHAAPHQRRDPL